MRFFLPIALAILFIAWALYRLLIKKDLKQHRNEFSFGLFFMGIWAVIYWWAL